ncbi:MAG: hypothetical protein ACKO0Z_24575 [Betaproteobacteria bacterium]
MFDVSTNEWHQRKSYGYDNWRPVFTAQIDGVTFAGDSLTGRIAKLDGETFTEFGSIVRAEGTCPPVSGGSTMIHHRLEMMFEAGVGTLATPAPQVMLKWSDDNGKSWSNEIWRNLGAQGGYGTRTIWNRLGKAKKHRIYKWAISDSVRRTLIDATLDLEPCAQ